MFRPLLEAAMANKCTQLWREAHFEVKSSTVKIDGRGPLLEAHRPHHFSQTWGLACSSDWAASRRRSRATLSGIVSGASTWKRAGSAPPPDWIFCCFPSLADPWSNRMTALLLLAVVFWTGLRCNFWYPLCSLGRCSVPEAGSLKRFSLRVAWFLACFPSLFCFGLAFFALPVDWAFLARSAGPSAGHVFPFGPAIFPFLFMSMGGCDVGKVHAPTNYNFNYSTLLYTRLQLHSLQQQLQLQLQLRTLTSLRYTRLQLHYTAPHYTHTCTYNCNCATTATATATTAATATLTSLHCVKLQLHYTTLNSNSDPNSNSNYPALHQTTATLLFRPD